MASSQQKSATPEEIWEILREVSKEQKEAARRFQEIAASQEKVIESQERAIESQEKAIKGQERVTKNQERTDKQIDKNTKNLKRLEDLFTGQWGKLMESLVKGDLVRVLRGEGVDVVGLARETSHEHNGKTYEFDIIALDGDTVVAVEVKTTLRLDDVDYFESKMSLFKKVFPEYKDRKLLGAVAYLRAHDGMKRYSEKKGFYVIEAVGGSARIVNGEGFKAKVF